MKARIVAGAVHLLQGVHQDKSMTPEVEVIGFVQDQAGLCAVYRDDFGMVWKIPVAGIRMVPYVGERITEQGEDVA